MLNAPIIAIGLVTGAACGLAAGFVSGRTVAHPQYLISLERAEQGFNAACKPCLLLSGRDWERCITRALVDKWRAVADADAARRNTPESYRVRRFVNAGTALLMQTQDCSSLPAASRMTCDKAALEAYRQAISRAASSEFTGQDCTVPGCPNRFVLPPRGAVKPRDV